MKNILKINCYNTYKAGIDYKKEAEKLEKAMAESKKILEDIYQYWRGDDYVNFHNNFGAYLNDMDEELKKLNECIGTMKKAALSHGKVDADFSNQLKRRIEDEQA